MKTRIIKLRSCLIDAKQFLNGGPKINEGKEEVGRKGRIVRRWRKEWTLLNSLFYPSSSPLSCIFLRVTWKSIIEGITHSLNILEEWGVRSEDRGTEDAWMFPLWKFFQHLWPVLTADQMWQLTSCSSLFVKRLLRKSSHFTSISFVTSFK